MRAQALGSYPCEGRPWSRSWRRPAPAGGFTLLELLVVIALIGVFVTVAVPSYNKMLQDNRIVAGLNAFAGTLAESRSEAVTRGASVSVCASANATTTTPTCASNGTNWAQGWISFVDVNNNPSTYSSGDILLRQHGPLDTSIVLGNIGSSTNGNYIEFDRMGFAQPTFAPPASSVAIVACPSDGNVKQARAIVLELSGSVHTATDTTGNGVVDFNGSDVTCP